MPIYEYQCASCHHHFDLMQKINDEPATQCPECHKNTVIKLISAAGFQLKGTGWYATDFKDKKSAPGSDSNKSKETASTAQTTSSEPAKSSKGDSE